MSVIIRLQNLPWSANALDIRGFFRGLSIPDGGVHIVGGEMGDAFIAFSTDEDARQAMMLDRGKINEVQIRLLLSSRAEMQKVIEKARQVSLSMMQMATQQKSQSPLLTTNSAMQPSAVQSLTKPQISQLPQPPSSQVTDTPLVTPQPPVITSNSLTNILSNNSNQRLNKVGPTDSKPYQSYSQIYGMNDNPVDPRIANRDKSIYDINTRDAKPFDNDDKNRGRSRELDRDRHRSSRSSSRSRDRRRSRSRDRGGRRRRNRSRSHSRDRRNRYRRSRSRERSRERNRNGNRGRDSDRERDRDRDRGRDRRDSRDEKRDSKQRDVDKNKKIEKIEKNDGGDSPMIIADDDDNDAPGFIQEKKNANIWDNKSPAVNTSSKTFENNYVQAYTTQAQASMPSYQTNIANINTPANMQMNLIQSQFQQLQQQLQHPPPNLRNNDQVNTGPAQNTATPSMNSLNFQGYFNSNLVPGFNNYSLNSGANVNAEDNKRPIAFQNPYTMSSTFSVNKSDNVKKEEEAHNNTTNFAGIFSTNSSKDDADKNKPLYSNYAAFQTQNKKADDLSERGSGTPNSGSSDPYKTPDTKNSGEVNYDELKGRCIKISNMCQSTSYSDLRRFFSGLYISNNGIKMINDKHGLRIGVAYIRFVRPESKPKAFTRNGLSLKSKKVLIESVSEDEFDAAQDSFKPLRRRGYDEDDRDQRRDDGRDSLASQEPFSALMITDLPHFTKEQDIMKMFSNYSLLDIILRDDYLEDDSDSKAQYVAYVKFHQADDAKAAYQDIAKHYIGYKKVTVKALSDHEFTNAKEKHSAELEALVRPSDIDEIEEDDDLRQPITRAEEERDEGKLRIDEDEPRETMEEDFDLNEEKVQRLHEESNEPIQTYEPDDEQLVNEDSKSADTARTLSSDNRDPRIDQDRGTNAEIPSLLNLPPTMSTDPRRRDNRPSGRSRFSNDDNSNQNQKPSNFVLVRNCDYKSTKLDFAKFFFSAGLNPTRVEILYNNRNKPSGECIVEFSCPEDADRALFKSNTLCGSRRIRLEVVPPSFVANCLGQDFLKASPMNNSMMPSFGNNDMRNYNTNIPEQQSNMNNPFNNPDFSMNRPDDSNSTGGRFNNPFRAGGNSNMNNSSNNNNNNNNTGGNNNSRGGPDNSNSRTNRRGPRTSRFSDFNETSNNSMGSTNNNKNSMIRFGNDNSMNQQQQQQQQITQQQQQQPQQQSNDVPQTLSNATVDQFGQPGCVVGMENVPYKAGIEDILEFFGKFDVQPHNVIRRYNDDGTPTGDARVAFRSPLEARTAIENRNHHKIMNRTIFLNLV